MNGMVYVNGRLTREEDAVVPVFDHGFLYGEGVYEVCRAYRGRPFLLDRHLRRLRASASLIALPVPGSDADLGGRIDETLGAAGLGPGQTEGDAYVRLLLTRGVGDLTYDPAACPEPTLVVIARPFTPPPLHIYEDGVRVALVAVQRNHPRSLNPLIKSNNLLNNALAMQAALRTGGFEAVMRNHLGEIAECSQSNLFIVSGGELSTPPLDAGLLAGITREFVLELARDAGIPSGERTLRDEDLLGADEAFLTSTTREIVPIVRVDEAAIGNGRPGPVTRRLMALFQDALQG